MKVVVVGAGNLGLACAARMAASNVEVILCTSQPDRWRAVISVEDCNGRSFQGKLAGVTDDVTCVSEADMVFLAVPGNVMRVKMETISRYICSGTPIVSVFSGDGFFFIAEEVLGGRWPVVGFQRVPFICRTKVPYRVGGITGYRRTLRIACRNVENEECWADFFAHAFGTPVELLDNYYEAALINGNVVMHPARLMSLRRTIETKGPFRNMPLFYEEWDDVASDYAIRLDADVCAVALVKGVRLVPFLTYYESCDVKSLTCKIRSIAAFKGMGSPISPTGCIDFESRYVQADINVALRYVKEVASNNGVETPCINEIMALEWPSMMKGC